MQLVLKDRVYLWSFDARKAISKVIFIYRSTSTVAKATVNTGVSLHQQRGTKIVIQTELVVMNNLEMKQSTRHRRALMMVVCGRTRDARPTINIYGDSDDEETKKGKRESALPQKCP
ncbi:hypothetical protein BOTCAL_0125g00240 [Botryotinia calthae]|uniref:Uncharacterized protein n=1 Tax=Botryotinia calthae TaxID=38488 RepID=A0A4Y8D4A9_9HELO|nr:hypothetical protein BOTCAL_0125g00240 [Botryotinia calthae]